MNTKHTKYKFNKHIFFLISILSFITYVYINNLIYYTEAKNIDTTIKVNEDNYPYILITIEDDDISFNTNGNTPNIQDLVVSVESTTGYLFGLSSSNLKNNSNVIKPPDIYAKIANKNNSYYKALDYNFISFYKNYSLYSNTKYELEFFIKSKYYTSYSGNLNLHVKPF